jgi:hypothetical protein
MAHLGDKIFRGSVTLQTEGTDPTHAITKAYVDKPESDIVFEVDSVLGDDANDGIAAPFKTLYRASQIRPGKYNIKILLKAGTHYLHDFGDLTDPDQPVWDGLGFGHALNPIQLVGEVVVEDTFTTLSSGGGTNTITKDSSTPDWTPGEHVGRFMRFFAYGLYETQLPIVNNTATVLELAAVDPGGTGWPFPVLGEDAEILSNAAIIKPALTNGAFSPNGFQPRAMLLMRNIIVDANSEQWTCIDANSFAPGLLHIEFCALLNGTNGILSNGHLSAVGCHFENISGDAIGAFGEVSAVRSCHFVNCGTAMRCDGVAYLDIQFYASLKDVTCALAVGNRGIIRHKIGTMKLDNVQDFCRMEGYSIFRSTNDLEFVAGYESPTRYGFYLQGGDNSLTLYDSASSIMTPATSYFQINSASLSLANYLTDGADVDFPLNNLIHDV